MSNLYVALLHHPMQNRRGEVVTTSMTSLDVHDIARSAKTYGASRYYVVTPMKTQREISRRLKGYWTEQEKVRENENRGQALELVSVLDKLEEAVLDVEDREQRSPQLVGTSARDLAADRLSYQAARSQLDREDAAPLLVLFGTGWGFADSLLEELDRVLPPIEGVGDFNHLSVRAAAAITLDRLQGKPGA